MASVCNVENASSSTKLLASTTLRLFFHQNQFKNKKIYKTDFDDKLKMKRNILGTKTLQEILSDRESTAEVKS